MMNSQSLVEGLLWGLLGGALIGLAAATLLLFNGRIAGISGIYGGALDRGLQRSREDMVWRLTFIAGLLAGGVVLRFVNPALLPVEHVPWGGASGMVMVAFAGILVGFGTRLGSGCTSGHGVCGVSRMSIRSVIATLMFMFTGIVTVWLVRYLLGV